MNESVKELHVFENNDNNIFSPSNDLPYIIPLYQRGYTWEENELIQLIEDILYLDTNSNYYLGALIVSRQDDRFEVVDGQQRLTSLYLLLNCLGVEVEEGLRFACRDASNYTLKHVTEVIKEIQCESEVDWLESSLIDPSIENGIRIIYQEIHKGTEEEMSERISKVKNNLMNVVLYRVEVPQYTDLNHYFEIMNTRGEQLEQHDILKARLMSFLTGGNSGLDQELFASIWDACSDMTGYVQMHFKPKLREILFGENWDQFNHDCDSLFKEYENNSEVTDAADMSKASTIKEIIKQSSMKSNDVADKDGFISFESIIDFPYFLLHALSVFLHKDYDLLDDRKLLSIFEEYYINLNKIEKDTFARNFIYSLLKIRFYFDKFLIKREFTSNLTDGRWSLNTLRRSRNSPAYSETFSTNGSGHCDKNLKIQSALRVSYTSPRSMHWITQVLQYLYDDKDITNLLEFTERIAAEAVYKLFLKPNKENNTYNMGVGTPHIVFNYLDYLLWCDDPNVQFDFEFRNSVEHWYPRNPSDGTFEKWSEADMFGNLCLIQRDVNSRFSNRSPKAKKNDFKKMIDKGSLKLRDMSKCTVESDDKDANQYWREIACKEHHDRMIDCLRKACQNIK